MGYLQPADYEAYGLAPETADELVTMASALMNGHCRRPSLMAMQYVERVRLSEHNQTARLSYGPLFAGAITGVRVRYGRNSREGFGGEIAQVFGLPGTWTSVDSTTIEVYELAREISFAYNVLGLAYNEAEVTYTAGFTDVPDQVKAACAQIVKNAQTTPGLNVKTSRLDTMQMEYFGPSLVDDGVRAMLKPFVAEKL